MRRDVTRRWLKDRPAVAVGIPMVATLPRPAVVQFLHLVRALRDDDHLLLLNDTADADAARNQIVTKFLELPESVKYLLLFDDDMVVPQYTIELLTFHERPFVSGLCTMKVPPYQPVAYKQAPMVEQVIPGHEHYGTVNYRYHTIDVPDKPGLLDVDGVGAACVCLSRDLLQRIEPPWFKFEGGGEDLYFCRKVLALGESILIDTRVKIGHVGQVVADFDLWRSKYRDEFLGDKDLLYADELTASNAAD